MALAKETKAKGWWLSYSDVICEGFDVYIGLEEAAERLEWYESELVPGLLQTADYARAIMATKKSLTTEEAERRVQLRIARQALITRKTKPPMLNVVLNESILRRQVGDSAVMVCQLEHLTEVSRLRNVRLRVLPFATGTHLGITTGPFVVLKFPLNGNGQPSEPSTIYVESLTGALFLDKRHELEQYQDAFADIWNKSLDEDDSRRFIEDAAEEMCT